MSDIYKKLYGYDDNIQLKDDDIKTLEAGVKLLKMRPKKYEFDFRTYRLDMINNQIVANTLVKIMIFSRYPLLVNIE